MEGKKMELKRVLGFTTNGRNSIISQPFTGNLIYVAGCVVVILDRKTRVQRHLISETGKQSITNLAITQDGRFLATADCGQRAFIRIWDLFKMKVIVEFQAHNYELSCMTFSQNGHLLVSVGSQHDLSLKIWDWKTGIRLTAQKVATKVRSISFSSDDSYFVTVGEAYVKFWYIQHTIDQPTANQNDDTIGSSLCCDSFTPQGDHSLASSTATTTTMTRNISISARSASLGEQKRASFCDVKCGKGSMSSSTFCITKSGLLCELNSKRLLHKWVDLRTPSANCLAISENFLVVGCANGVARCFNTAELRFLRNLPRPHPLGSDSLEPAAQQQRSSSIHPNTISLSLDQISLVASNHSIACIYDDRSLYLWEFVGDSNSVLLQYSAMYHSSCIWGLEMCQQIKFGRQTLPTGGFITCSSDDTIRIWDPNVYETAGEFGTANGSKRQRFYSELLKIIFTNSTYKFLRNNDPSTHSTKQQQQHLASRELQDNEQSMDAYDNTKGLRCLRLSPSGRHLAVGTRSGAIKVFELSEVGGEELIIIAAHDAEVLCLEYSDPSKFAGFCYLASSSRDKLIHIFDASTDEYKFLQTIDDHSSSITALRFINNRARDCLQLVSCGADQKIIFRNGLRSSSPSGSGAKEEKAASEKRSDHEDSAGNRLAAGRQWLNFVSEQLIEGKNTLYYDMEVDSESSCLMTACQDRMVRLFNVAKVKYQSAFKGSPDAVDNVAATNDNEDVGGGALIKISLDPTCTFLATSSTNKSLSIYDYQRGECIASVSCGLSDLITDLKFSPDGRHLVGCSGDGCIFVWTSPAELSNAIVGQLSPLRDTQAITQISRQATIDWSSKQREAANYQPDYCEELPAQNEANQAVRYQVQSAFGERQPPALKRNHPASHEADRLLAAAASNYALRDDAAEKDHDDDYDEEDDDDNADNNVGDKQQSIANGILKAVSKARLLQSRDNLDRISSREKFLSESLAVHTAIDGSTKSSQLQADGSSATTSGLHLSSSLSVASLSDSHNKQQQQQADQRLGRLKGSFNDESSTGIVEYLMDREQALAARGNNVVALERSQSIPHQLAQPARRRASFCDDDEEEEEEEEEEDLERLSLARELERSKAASGSGKFTQLGSTGNNYQPHSRATKSMERPAAAGRMRSASSECNLIASANGLPACRDCGKLDMAKLSQLAPTMPLNLDLCQHVVDELQALSRLATRLHQRLVASGQRNLSAKLARGVQSSMDILSIVPARMHPNHQELQVDRRKEQQSQRQVAATKAQRLESKSSTCLSDFAGRQSRGAASAQKASQLSNIDQVLEAYSDRLFRMVQERMVEQQLENGSTMTSQPVLIAGDTIDDFGRQVE